MSTAGVYDDGQAISAGAGGDGVEYLRIESVKRDRSGVENGLNSVYICLLQRIHHLAGFAGRGGKTRELAIELRFHWLGNLIEILGSMAAGRGKKRSAEEELRAQLFAAVHDLAHTERGIERVA